jgi:DNA-binding GntR family transcriptional regulator
VVRVTGEGERLGVVLQSSLAEQEECRQRGGDGFVAADRAFHRAIVAANGNEILTRQYDALRDRQQRIAASAVARDPARIGRFIAEHRAIAQAITADDPSRAVTLTTDHLRSAHALAHPRRH